LTNFRAETISPWTFHCSKRKKGLNASLWQQEGHLHAFNSTQEWTALVEKKCCS
jgi:hypothetical protein